MSARADLLILNARPWTDGAPVAGADALVVGAGRVLALGRAEELAPFVHRGTERIDARGATVTPGLWDAHLHLLTWARARAEVQLAGTRSRAEALARVRAWLAAHPGDGPLVGRGWDANGWPERPDRATLDTVTGARPALLHSKDFHTLWVNSAALRAAGVRRASPDPDGGCFERDGAGEPSGIVREHAVRAFAALEVAARPDDAAARGALLREAATALNACGVTAVQDMDPLDLDRDEPWPLRDARAATLRAFAAVGHRDLDRALARRPAYAGAAGRTGLGPLKLFADGTLGSQTAALLEPYSGGGSGMELMSRDELRTTIARALAGGLAVAVHAIGDRAVRHALDAFEAAGEARARAPLPCRIEHAQLVHPDDLPRFAALGVAASLQPLHCTSDQELAERHWGAHREFVYPWASLLARGTLLAFGSDAPVESPSVAAGLHAAVTRQRADGTPPGRDAARERVTLDQALRAYTEGPARLAGTWPAAGRLAAGASADVVVWSDDLHALPPAALALAAPVLTLFDGAVVHRAAVAPGIVRSVAR